MENSLDERTYAAVLLLLRRLMQQSMPVRDPEGRLQDLHWCRCSCCQLMPIVKESVCCRELKAMAPFIGANQCVTQYARFEERVLNRDELIMLLAYCTDIPTEDFLENESKLLRMTAYGSFIAMTYGLLSRGQTTPIPSCVISAIRDRYPDLDMDYKDIDDMIFSLHELCDWCTFDQEIGAQT